MVVKPNELNSHSLFSPDVSYIDSSTLLRLGTL